MQIVIPMSGLGSRFLAAGYDLPKPLIPVHGKPMVEWVTRMFPGEDDVTFICREEHLESTLMRETLQRIKPNARILAIPGHKKGPVYAVAQVAQHLDPSRPVLVSYCDYYMHWDYPAFKQMVSVGPYDGAIPCYTGFHPNLVPRHNLYASCRINERHELAEIREKFSFEADKTRALHSPGVYYFSSGELLRHYFDKMLEQGEALNGEYYVSLVYNLLVADGRRVAVPANVSHFCQWGTPEDLREYEDWIDIVRRGAK